MQSCIFILHTCLFILHSHITIKISKSVFISYSHIFRVVFVGGDKGDCPPMVGRKSVFPQFYLNFSSIFPQFSYKSPHWFTPQIPPCIYFFSYPWKTLCISMHTDFSSWSQHSCLFRWIFCFQPVTMSPMMKAQELERGKVSASLDLEVSFLWFIFVIEHLNSLFNCAECLPSSLPLVYVMEQIGATEAMHAACWALKSSTSELAYPTEIISIAWLFTRKQPFTFYYFNVMGCWTVWTIIHKMELNIRAWI